MKFTVKPAVRVGDQRTLTRFALLPVRLDDDSTLLWGERYQVTQRLHSDGITVYWATFSRKALP